MQRRVAEAEAEASALVDEESYDEFAWDLIMCASIVHLLSLIRTRRLFILL